MKRAKRASTGRNAPDPSVSDLLPSAGFSQRPLRTGGEALSRRHPKIALPDVLRAAVLLLLVIAASCRAADSGKRESLRRFDYSRLAMGVEARIVVWGPTEDAVRAAVEAAYARIERIAHLASDYVPDGPLARLEQAAVAQPVFLDPELLDLLTICAEMHGATGGAFDPALGRLTRLWRSARRTGIAPTASELAEARAKSGWRFVTLDVANGTLKLDPCGPRFDFGGIAKGFAADAALKELERHGFASALIDFSGDITVGAAPPGRAGWRIAAGCGGPDPPRVVEIEHASIATSGDAIQAFVDADGQRYSHVLDGRNGTPLRRHCVSILSSSGARADALATAASAFEGHEADELLRASGARLLRSTFW